MILSKEKRDILKEDADQLLSEVESLMSALHLEESIQKLQVLINDYEILGDYESLLKCHLYNAFCQYNLGNLKLAFEITNEYEALCHEYKVTINKAEYYALLGLQYMYKEDFEKAVYYFTGAADDALMKGLYRRYITSKKHVAHVQIILGQMQDSVNAINDTKQYISYLEEHDVNRVEVFLVEAQAYLAMGEYTRAKEELQQVEAHPILQVDDVTHSLFYEYCARYYYEVGEYELAYEKALRGLNLLENKMQYVSEHELYELLIKICQQFSTTDRLLAVYANYVESLKASKKNSYELELSKRDFEDMKKLTETDNLTGVYNRKYLIEKATEWLNYAALNQEVVICSVFDIDHFKQINDTYGHLIGDELLKALAVSCENILPDANMFLARYGGDEFVIMHKTNNLEESMKFYNYVYDELNALTIELNQEFIRLSVSMGISYTDYDDAKTFTQLFKEADQALYFSKEHGRNRLSIFS